MPGKHLTLAQSIKPSSMLQTELRLQLLNYTPSQALRRDLEAAIRNFLMRRRLLQLRSIRRFLDQPLEQRSTSTLREMEPITTSVNLRRLRRRRSGSARIRTSLTRASGILEIARAQFQPELRGRQEPQVPLDM